MRPQIQVQVAASRQRIAKTPLEFILITFNTPQVHLSRPVRRSVWNLFGFQPGPKLNVLNIGFTKRRFAGRHTVEVGSALVTIDKEQRRAMLSWLVVSALFLLCGLLGLLQYRWIGEVSVAEREHLGQTLERSLNQLSQDLATEIAASCQAVLPASPSPDAVALQADMVTRFQQWKKTSRHSGLFRRIAVAVSEDDDLVLHGLDLDRGSFARLAWPADWSGLNQRLHFRLSAESRPGQTPPGPPPDPSVFRADLGLLFEVPVIPGAFIFGGAALGGVTLGGLPGVRQTPFVRREAGWVIFELNPDYIRDGVLPELVQNHLGSGGSLDYQVEVVTRTTPPATIWRSDPQQKNSIVSTADASIGLLESRNEGFRVLSQGGRRRGPGPQEGFVVRGDGPFLGPGSGPGTAEGFVVRGDGPFPGPGSGPGTAEGFVVQARGPGMGPGPGFSRWQMFVRHRSGSLEALVAQARLRNLAVTAGVLLLILASVAALIRFTRRAQKLAALQMDFVAGVSHELRTPLAVINTAGYNLRGKIAYNPAQVERYGELIQQESGRLKQLVEQVLGFASANAGRVIHEREPVSVETLIEQTLESSRAAVQQAKALIEMTIGPSLPPLLADPLALQRAIGNLVSNAAKYGTEGSNWIGISARRIEVRNQVMVEIKVSDRGPGIPEDEQEHVFDPFFRGRRAMQDQVHGTGLGLNLVRRIVEAHGGSIEMKSAAMNGTEFTIRIPAMPPEHEDEFAHTFDRG
jgi:signal transduction histidine kinase